MTQPKLFQFVATALIFGACFTDSAKGQNVKQQVPVEELDRKFELTGRTHEPLGKVIRLEGVIVEGRFKGYEGGPNLRVQRIDGRATQEDIQIQVRPTFLDFGQDERVPKLLNGKTYELTGYETGGFVGVPNDAMKLMSPTIQTTDHYFKCEFSVVRGKAIDPIHFSAADFLDRDALLEGTAVSDAGQAYIRGDGWRLLVRTSAPWPKELDSKLVEANGVVRKGADAATFHMENAHDRLVRLEDQVGREVELRATAWSMNGHWWITYRGEDMFVVDLSKLPGWTGENHGRPVLIRGMLKREERPDLANPHMRHDPKDKEYFVVHNATWQPTEPLRSTERVEWR